EKRVPRLPVGDGSSQEITVGVAVVGERIDVEGAAPEAVAPSQIPDLVDDVCRESRAQSTIAVIDADVRAATTEVLGDGDAILFQVVRADREAGVRCPTRHGELVV